MIKFKQIKGGVIRARQLNSRTALSPQIYLKQQEYFDASIVKAVERQQIIIDKLNNQVKYNKCVVARHNATIKGLRFKNNDLMVLKFNLETKLCDKETDIAEFIKNTIEE